MSNNPKHTLLVWMVIFSPLSLVLWAGFAFYRLARYGGIAAIRLAKGRSEPMGLKDEYDEQ